MPGFKEGLRLKAGWNFCARPLLLGKRNGTDTPRFLTIGYGDRAGYDATSEVLRTAAHAQDAMLRAAGAVIGVAGRPAQVRNPGAGGVERQEGPFLRSDLPVAGFALIEAADLEDAVQKVATTPCAVAQGVVEVWPLDEL